MLEIHHLFVRYESRQHSNLCSNLREHGLYNLYIYIFIRGRLEYTKIRWNWNQSLRTAGKTFFTNLICHVALYTFPGFYCFIIQHTSKLIQINSHTINMKRTTAITTTINNILITTSFLLSTHHLELILRVKIRERRVFWRIFVWWYLRIRTNIILEETPASVFCHFVILDTVA